MKLTKDGGVLFKGYHISETDIGQIMKLIRSVTILDSIPHNANVTKIVVGCQAFTRIDLEDLFSDYKQLKKQERDLREREKRFLVKMGDRVMHTPSSRTYLVARAGNDKYNLISLESGNRWNDKLVTIPSVKVEVPLDLFLCLPSDLKNWKKVIRP